MENKKVNRLNMLFEKMVSNSADVIEKRELNSLYQEYIDDGRDNHQKPVNKSTVKNLALN